MDPATAFSVVCGVIQVVHFSASFLSKAKELCKNGCIAENTDLKYMGERLVRLQSELLVGPQSSSTAFSQPEQQELSDLAGKCSQTALELYDEVQKL